MKKAAIVTLCVLAGLLAWYLRPRRPEPALQAAAVGGKNWNVPQPKAGAAPQPSLAGNYSSGAQPAGVTVSATASAGVRVASRPAQVPEPSIEKPPVLPPETLLENVRTSIRQYGLTFGGNPVGTNPEITRALNGDNPKQIRFLGPDGNRINGKGELVDPWGTPYFFHQLSAMETEIRSAGPDKTMWTADDLVIR